MKKHFLRFTGIFFSISFCFIGAICCAKSISAYAHENSYTTEMTASSDAESCPSETDLADTGAGAETEAPSESQSNTETEAIPDQTTESESAAETATIPDTEEEMNTETETQSTSEPDSLPESESSTQSENVTETETESTSESFTETTEESITETESFTETVLTNEPPATGTSAGHLASAICMAFISAAGICLLFLFQKGMNK